MNTSGFYKIEGETLLHSPTTVESAAYFLNSEIHETYNYPVDGWYWFDSEDLARESFNIKGETNVN